jgi:hypothetical protein
MIDTVLSLILVIASAMFIYKKLKNPKDCGNNSCGCGNKKT